jgi:hypothetical protein
MDCVTYAQKMWGAVIAGERRETTPNENLPCCDEMEAFLAFSSGAIELCTTIEDYRQVVTHPEHVELRHEIKNHVCKG